MHDFCETQMSTPYFSKARLRYLIHPAKLTKVQRTLPIPCVDLQPSTFTRSVNIPISFLLCAISGSSRSVAQGIFTSMQQSRIHSQGTGMLQKSRICITGRLRTVRKISSGLLDY